MLEKIKQYSLTHDSHGGKYGWVIVNRNGKLVDRGYSKETFIRSAMAIISTMKNPDCMNVINPETGKTYRLTNVLYVVESYHSIQKVFTVA